MDIKNIIIKSVDKLANLGEKITLPVKEKKVKKGQRNTN